MPPLATLLQEALDGKRQVVFLVGAGVSVPSGLPGFLDFSKAMLDCVLPRELPTGWKPSREKAIERLVSIVRPEIIMQVMVEELGRMALDFYLWLDGGEPNGNHEFLVKAIKSGNHVITPNLDTLIERASQDSIKVAVSRDEYSRLARNGGTGPRLWKYHGSLSSTGDDGKPRVSIDDVGQAVSPKMDEILSNLIVDHDVIVVGYRGMDHFSLQPVLLKSDSPKAMFWTEYEKGRVLGDLTPLHEDGLEKELNELLRRRGSGEVLKADAHQALEILRSLKPRSHRFRIACDSSELLHRAIGASLKHLPMRGLESPSWSKRIEDLDRLLVLARILQVAGQVPEMQALLGEISRLFGNDNSRLLMRVAEMRLTRATEKDYQLAISDVSRAIEIHESGNQTHKAMAARVDLINLYRRAKKWSIAWKLSYELETWIQQTRLVEEDPIDVERGVASQRGLLWHGNAKEAPPGYGQEQALSDLDRGVQLAGKRPLQRATSLNSKGLVLSKLGQDVSRPEFLREARQCQEDALDANLGLGRNRECFQNARNLAWTLKNLSDIDSPDNQRHYLELALDAGKSAQAFLGRLGPRAAPGEAKAAEDVLDAVHQALSELPAEG